MTAATGTAGEPGFEILEHTADVGIRARAADLAGVIEQATLALASVIGVHRPGHGDEVAIEVEASDPGGVMVDWLDEVLYLHDVRGAGIGGVRVGSATGRHARGTVVLVELPPEGAEGTQVKAITYHRLRVEDTGQGWIAEVYLDV